uniref:Uncharacterized protein n=1 Tax=Caenorhabditis japonica TaxID=281687 RepID=A0A8R1DRE9_CAEJA
MQARTKRLTFYVADVDSESAILGVDGFETMGIQLRDRELPGGLAMLKRKREEIEEDSICNLIAGVGVEDEKEKDNEEVDEADDSEMSLQFE